MANLDYPLQLYYHLPDPDSWSVLIAEGFSTDLLWDDEAIAEIYNWAAEHLKEHGVPPSVAVLEDEFDIEWTEPETTIGDLIERLRKDYMVHEGRKSLEKLGTQFNEDPMLVAHVGLPMMRGLKDLLTKKGEAFSTGDFDRTWKGYLEEKEAGPGPSLGDPVLDDFFFGQRGITVFLGAPKAGKSWYVVKAVISNVRQGRHAWLYPLELPAQETHQRLLHMTADVPWWKYINQSLGQAEEEAMREAAEELDGQGVYHISQPPEGQRTIDDLVGRAQDAGADVVFIDQLQYVEHDGKPLGEHNDTGCYWAVLGRARTLSRDTPIVFAHPFNQTIRGANEMPDAEQAKGSSAIKETSSLVLGLWASKEMRQNDKLQIGALAARNHALLKWEADVEMSKGCSMDITNVVEDE